ncbi:hypothetical protein CRUP_032175 [Coryphaenoides rupestris]|nr:hypothetical protein CRUP_032175 [Coryphaenoides rupestris]
MHWVTWSVLLLLCWGSSEQQRDGRAGEPAVDAFGAAADATLTRGAPHRQRSAAPPPPAEPLDFGFVPSAVYDTHAYYEPGAMGVLFHVVHAFLYVVQPNPFPIDLIVRVIQENMGSLKLDKWRKPENVVLVLQCVC